MNEREIFTAALHRPPEERSAFLDEACHGDALLRQQVDALLCEHAQLGSYLESPALATMPTIADPITERPGTVIGPYKLLEQIGEGGFGVVFMADQQEPIRRKVALKILKPGMDSKQVIARFEAERQALALMDHPNIAKVLDGGQTDSCRPYFVMDLVKGLPITEYCDQNQLTPKERLELFVHLCQSVQHAHQKGIIHRDLKPSNVLVTLQDGAPLVKVIDFGIAKALGQQLTDKTLFTGFAQMIGTPLYMSPEQAALSNADVDTRSDIYSLGVLLYELLTGATPFDKKQFKEVGYDELRRIIREEEPPKPSTRLSTSETLPAIAAARHMEPGKLTKLVRGELDWIVMKSLEKDRNRRYETASAFAADVQRYLKDEPVEACPPSAWYRLRKFARRNKPAVMTAVLLLTMLVLSGGGGLWLQGQRVARDRDVAGHLEEAERWERQGNWPQALRAVERAEGRLAGGGPAALRRRAEQVLERAQFVADLEEIRLKSSATREGNYDHARAAQAYAKAFTSRGWDFQALGAEEIADQIRASPIRVQLVAALDDWGRNTAPADFAGRAKLLTVARLAEEDQLRRQLRDLAMHKDWAALERLARHEAVLDQPPSSLMFLSFLLYDGKSSSSVDLLRRAQQRYPDDFWLNFELGVQLSASKKWDEAIAFYRGAVAVRPSAALVHYNLGVALYAKKQLDEAIQEYRTAIAHDPKFADAHDNLGVALADKKQLDEAIQEYHTAIALDPEVPQAHNNLGSALSAKGQLDEAIQEYRTAIALDPKYAKAHNRLGRALQAKGQLDEAIQKYRTAIALDQHYADAHNNLGVALYAQAHNDLGVAPADKKLLDEAIAAYHQAITLNPKDAGFHTNLGNALRAKGQLDDAIQEYVTAIALDDKFALAHYNFGAALADKKQPDEAITEFQKAIALDDKLAQAHKGLGNVLRAKGQLDDAIQEYRTAITLDWKYAEAHNDLGVALYLEAHSGLAVAVADEKLLDEAIKEFQKAIAVDDKLAQPHGGLGRTLLRLGRFTEAREATRRFLDLLQPNAPLRQQATRQLQQCEQLLALDQKLAAILEGTEKPASNAERIALAQLCQQPFHKCYVASARFYAEAFDRDTKLADDLEHLDRYNAASAAALAGCGQGEDARALPDKAAFQLRQQALDWLKADLAAYAKLAERDEPATKKAVRQRLEHWRQNADLVSVRDRAALDKLPEAERAAWRQLWADVDALLTRVKPEAKEAQPHKP
jgi:serine/threonine protein kinase/tetratricopeptide (TPR) repeat protein